jgi:DMSO/TMAO reductase YedYZ molybdopterin-dependent catalytic subunit
MTKQPRGDVKPALLRRSFLAPLVVPYLWNRTARADSTDQAPDAENIPARFAAPQCLITPTEDFFVRNHFATPRLSAGFKLRVAGRVRSPFEIGRAELMRLPSRSLTVTLECAGSGLRGVSTTTWEGVPLLWLLKRANLTADVKYIRLVGADRGVQDTTTDISFARCIPVEKAMHPDTVIAFRMNSAPLPMSHGYPLRAIVPGWYGMDSVQWLARIDALEHPDTSFFMTQRYVAIRLATIGSERRPLTRIHVKSLIVEPGGNAVIPSGLVPIRGMAWAGENRIARVEISTDAGKNWSLSTLDKDVRPYTWVLWSYNWEPAGPGKYILVARASDDQGNTQPSARDSLRIDNYELNWCHSIRCEIR